MRSNGGGALSNVETLVSRFINRKTVVGYISHKTGFGHQDFSELYPIEYSPSSRIRYQKPVVVLANRGTFSAGNNFVSVMKALPNVIVIGDCTGAVVDCLFRRNFLTVGAFGFRLPRYMI